MQQSKAWKATHILLVLTKHSHGKNNAGNEYVTGTVGPRQKNIYFVFFGQSALLGTGYATLCVPTLYGQHLLLAGDG